MKFIILELALISKHGVEDEGSIDHLSISQLSFKNSSIIKFDFRLFFKKTDRYNNV